MDNSNKFSTILLKPEFDNNFRNQQIQRACVKVTPSHHVNYNLHKSKSISKDIKLSWKDINNSTNQNWNNQSQKSLNAKTQSQWKSSIKITGDSKKRDSLKEKNIESLQNTVTLDQYMGQGYKAIPIASVQSEFEGSEPIVDIESKYLEDDFEINETDEDKYSESNNPQSRQLESCQNLRDNSIQQDKGMGINSSLMLGNAKIKQKIIDKYSKNPKQKLHLQILSILASNKQSNELNAQSEQNSLDETRPSSPHLKIKTLILPSFNPTVKRSQCLSQSPIRSHLDAALKVPKANAPKQYYIKQYEENKNIETHIAFRNSFHNHKKSQEYNCSIGNMGKSINKSLTKKYSDDDLNIKIVQCMTQQKLNCYKEMVVKKELITERLKPRNGSFQFNDY